MFNKIKRLGRELIETGYSFCFNKSIGYVLMFHRVGAIEPDRIDCIGDLNVSTEALSRFIAHNKDKYDFISLDELYSRMTNDNKGKRPFICITFDDGFKDNLKYGLPVFEEHQVPFAVFITTEFINRHPAFNFPFILERIVRDNNTITISGKEFISSSREQKDSVFSALKEMVLAIPYDGFEGKFASLFQDYIKPDYLEDLTLTWKEVRALAASPLCTIGSHTLSHQRLSRLCDSDLLVELLKSKEQLEKHLGKAIHYVSYPFGWKTDVDERVFKAAQEAGYKMGFISWGGAIRRRDRDSALFQMKRLMYYEH